MHGFRRSRAPIAAAFAALAALLIVPAIHGAESARHGQALVAPLGNSDAPQSFTSSAPGDGRDTSRPCSLCIAITRANAGTTDAGGPAYLAAPLTGARLARFPAQPGPFPAALAPLSPRAPPALS